MNTGHPQGISGPLYLGMDTHALSEPALIQRHRGVGGQRGGNDGAGRVWIYPHTGDSHAILGYNRGRTMGLADGVVITPSHNPPEDGGYKYNPPSGGPADTGITRWIQERANEIMADGLKAVKRMPVEKALKADNFHLYDYVTPYVEDLNTPSI